MSLQARTAFIGAMLFVLAACAPRETRVRGVGAAPAAAPTAVVIERGGLIQPGTTVWISLDERLSADRTRVGDRFRAHLVDDVYSREGELLLPRGTPVLGHVADLRDSRRLGEPAVIALALDEIKVNGVRQPLSGTIVETDVPGAPKTGIRARDVLAGAAVGAILGGLLEGTEGVVAGGAIGAGAGTLISLGTSTVAAELPRGTEMAVRIDKPVRSLAALRGRRF